MANLTEPSDPGGKPKIPAFVLWVLGALPLGIWPLVAIANVMSLAAVQNPNDGPLITMVATGFQLTSLAYPLVFLVALAAAGAFKYAGKVAISRNLAWIPLAYLLVVMILFVGWMTFGT